MKPTRIEDVKTYWAEVSLVLPGCVDSDDYITHVSLLLGEIDRLKSEMKQMEKDHREDLRIASSQAYEDGYRS